MEASKCSDAQRAFILKQGADINPIADICRKAGISQATNISLRKAQWRSVTWALRTAS